MASLPLSIARAGDSHRVISKRTRGPHNVDGPWSAAFRKVVHPMTDGAKKLLALQIGRKSQAVVSRLLNGEGASAASVFEASRQLEMPPPEYLFDEYQNRVLAALERLRRAARLRYQTSAHPEWQRFQELKGNAGLVRADQHVLTVVSAIEDRIEREIAALERELAELGGDDGARPLGAARR
jgi:hypothetical protein